MTSIYRSASGEAAVKARYGEFLARWPVENQQLRIPTSQGETFVVASGEPGAPAIVLLHGSSINSASWMGDVEAWSGAFRVYAVDMIGEPGFSAPARPPLASGAYVEWLDEVLAGLGVERAGFVGISLGGWLALHYATHRPERAAAVVVLAPGGVGRQRNVLLWALPLLMLGPWGQKQLLKKIAGGAAAESEAGEEFGEFMGLVFANYRPRTETLPPITPDALRRLDAPLMAILGGKDVFIDAADTRRKLLEGRPDAEVLWLPDAGHMLIGHTSAIETFVRRALRG